MEALWGEVADAAPVRGGGPTARGHEIGQRQQPNNYKSDRPTAPSTGWKPVLSAVHSHQQHDHVRKAGVTARTIANSCTEAPPRHTDENATKNIQLTKIRTTAKKQAAATAAATRTRTRTTRRYAPSASSKEPRTWCSLDMRSMRPTMSVVDTPSVRLIILKRPMDLAYAYASCPSACST